jgi:hypothetical protein
MMCRSDWYREWALVGLALLATTGLVNAENCVSCQERITGEFFLVGSPLLADKQVVCKECVKLDTICATCRLPAKKDILALDDGRVLCALHAREAVLTPSDAEALFKEAKREMIRLLRGCGSTPDQTITLSLVDGREIGRLWEELRPGQARDAAVGLTRSRRQGTDFAHSIYLVRGLSRARFLATSAHEYTHAWMSENVPPDRKLDADAIEGFCELAAYRLMSDLHEDGERRVILTNAYTRGQIDTFVKAEDQHRFYRIVEWVKSGVEDRIQPDNTEQVLALKPRATVSAWPQSVPTQVPNTLQLKGISGGPGRWLALINDCTLGVGEAARVRVGAAKVNVRCLAATASSVTIELVDSGERQELRLHSR